MPQCIVCGESQFDCIDGHFYCSSCQTQSQHAIEEEQDDEYQVHGRGIRISQPAKAAVEVKTEKVDHGRPWITHEAFQIILREQVKALIKLGASAELKDVVFHLWVLYLRKIGVAFADPNNECTGPNQPLAPTKRTKGRLAKIRQRTEGAAERLKHTRDQSLAINDDPLVKPIPYWATMQTKQESLFTKKKAMKAQERAELNYAFGDEEFYEGDNPLEEDETQEVGVRGHGKLAADNAFVNIQIQQEVERHKREQEQAEDEEWTLRNEGTKANTVKRLAVTRTRLLHTVCFCYLGLRYTNSLVTPSDLVRWIHAGKLPWNNARTLLPDDMKMVKEDYYTFCSPDPPRVKQICWFTTKIAQLLGIETLPKVDMSSLASRYIMELRLPGDLHALVRSLMSQYPPHLSVAGDTYRSALCVQDHASWAMVYIIVTLKIIFGLDDHTEIALTEYAKELIPVIDAGPPLFIWADWMAAMEQKLALTRGQHMAQVTNDIRSVYSVDKLMRQYHTGAVHNAGSKVTTALSKYWKRPEMKEDGKEALLRPFAQLLDRVNAHSNSRSQAASGSQQRASQRVHFENPTLEDDMLSDVVQVEASNENDEKSKLRDFCGHTIQYITEADTFLDKLSNAGLSDYTVYSSCIENEDSDPEKDLQDSDWDNQSQATLDVPRKKRKQDAMRRLVQDRLKQSAKKRKKPRVNMEEILRKLCLAHESYTMYQPGSLDEASQHRSYRWLLMLCSHLVDTTPDDLHTLVGQMETAYVCQWDTISKRASIMRSKYLSRCRPPKSQRN